MKAIISRSAGILLVANKEANDYAIIDVIQEVERSPTEALYRYSVVRDWEEIEADDKAKIIELSIYKYWLARTVSHIRLSLLGLESSLEKSVLEDVEDKLSSRVSSEDVLNQLLIAPLANPENSIGVAKTALSNGLSAVAAILDGIKDLQPLISRLSDYWLKLPAGLFSSLPDSKESIWMALAEKGRMVEVLKADSKRSFEAKWNLIAWDFTSPLTRSGISALSKELSLRLFPEEAAGNKSPDTIDEEGELIFSLDEDQAESDYEAYQRAQKQIMAIVKAVSEGRDTRAEKFLRELVQDQTSVSGGENYAVKSLCNIANYCADMFRSDFEVICLDKALEIDPHDAWTLIQKADYLKRTGQYGQALVLLEQAQYLGESEVGKSSKADIYSQQGKFEEAIAIYEKIPNMAEKPAVLTAIADNLRKMGRLEDSRDLYHRVIDLTHSIPSGQPDTIFRAIAGLAEIDKRQGKLNESLIKYRDILRRMSGSNQDRIYYELGLCNVLKLLGELEEAYALINKVIIEYPFAMQARFIRGSILGLMDKENEGLKDLPESVGRSWREWIRQYYRGLLLFRLERYEDAKDGLLEALDTAIASEEEKSLLRMAAALCFLKENEIIEADQILSKIQGIIDSRIEYLSIVLKLHLAALRQDKKTVRSIKRKLDKLGIDDENIIKAVQALDKGNFVEASFYETEVLLRLAA